MDRSARVLPRAFGLGVALGIVLFAPFARAGVFFGAEVDGGTTLGQPSGQHFGYGFLGALGYRFGLGPVFLQPEAQGGYALFPDGTFPTSPLHAARVLGGARFGLGGLVQPAIYGHAGCGWLSSMIDGPAFDAGFSLGFKLVPVFSFGAQVGYNVIMDLGSGETTKWLSFGGHVGVDF
jgi:hypothetical protein